MGGRRWPVLSWLSITTWQLRPSSWPQKRKAAAHYVTGKPDVDNIVKLVADAMNGIAYGDDSRIEFTRLNTDGTERAEIVIRELVEQVNLAGTRAPVQPGPTTKNGN